MVDVSSNVAGNMGKSAILMQNIHGYLYFVKIA